MKIRPILLAGGLAFVGLGFAPVPADARIAEGTDKAGPPPRLEQIRYTSGGVQVPGRMFIAAGAGKHPTALLLHGFPGTELNLDLARSLQRAGWNVLAIHYRGMWGAPGQFSFSHTVEDAHAAVAWLRSPEAAEAGVDTSRIVVIGHSMGGFDAVMLGDDPLLSGYVLISAADVTRVFPKTVTPESREGFASTAYTTNATLDGLVADVRDHAAAWAWEKRSAELAGRPVLILTADDGLGPVGTETAKAIAASGKSQATVIHMRTDHSFNDHRLELATAVQTWLERHFDRP